MVHIIEIWENESIGLNATLDMEGKRKVQKTSKVSNFAASVL